MALNDKLRELFLLDKQVRGLQTRLDAATTRLKAQTKKLDQSKQQASELSDQAKRHQVKASSLEAQANDVDARVVKLREQMNNVKNNKEYSALLIEVNTLKIEKGTFEEQSLEEMGNVDRYKTELAVVEARIADQQKLVTLAENEVTQSRAEIGEQLDDLTRRRDEAMLQVPEDVQVAFKRLAGMYEGEAMAPIIEEDRRRMEYTCGGCFINLPVERVNGCMVRRDQLTFCSSCGRILYIDQEMMTPSK